jgi:hypothetical protein
VLAWRSRQEVIAFSGTDQENLTARYTMIFKCAVKNHEADINEPLFFSFFPFSAI